MSIGPARPALLRNRPFLLLWSAQAITQTAQHIIVFVLIVELEQRTRSSTYVSLLVQSFIVPAVMFGPIAGMFVDRTDKRSMLIFTNLLRTAAALAYIVIDPTWPTATVLVAIYAISATLATITQFFAPAEVAAIPLVVAGEQLAAANALFTLTFNASALVGFAVLGPLFIKLMSAHTVFVVVSSLYLFCTVLSALLPALPQGVQDARLRSLARGLRRAAADLYQTWQFLTGERALATAMAALAIASSIFLILGTLGVGLLARVLELPASDLAFVMAAGGAGLLSGLAVVPRLFYRVNPRALMEVGLGAMGGAILTMAVANLASSVLLDTVMPQLDGIMPQVDAVMPQVKNTMTLALVMLTAGVLGMGSAFVTVPAQTLLQQGSPASLRGRVFAVLFTFSNALAILPVLFSGALADLIGPQKVLVLVGAITLALAAVGRYQRLQK